MFLNHFIRQINIMHPMESEIIRKAKIYVEQYFEENIDKKYTYHTYNHTLKVYESARNIADESNILDDEIEVLCLAALFHDTGFSEGSTNHELRSAELASDYLSEEGYDEEKTATVARLINATSKDAIAKDRLEGMIKDADLSGLAHPFYNIESQHLRQEWENVSGVAMKDLEWNQVNLNFMKNHSYLSEAAKKLYKQGKKTNRKLVKERIAEIQRKEITISESKSAQTQFKTSLRNHIDLSSIADNKANIMLSVNALIITVAMPIIANLVIENAKLLIPAIILLTVCVTSMIYATLATRPIKMKGKVTLEEVKSGTSNLFFFGNFWQMTFKEYEEGIKNVVGDSVLMDNSITRDLFYLGKSLGGKYRNLRICYTIFMFGIVVAVIAFCIALFITWYTK